MESKTTLPDSPRREVSCGAIEVDLNYVRSRVGKVDAILQGVRYTEDYLRDDNNWIDFETLKRVYANIRMLFPGEPGIMREIGRSVLENDRSYRTIRTISVLLWNPFQIYLRVPKFIQKTFSFIHVEAEARARNHAVLTYRFDEGFEPNDDLLEHVAGIFEITPIPAGFAPASVTYERAGYDVTFQMRWGARKHRLFGFMDRIQVFRSAIEQLEEAKALLEEKYSELEDANRRIRDQLLRQVRLHDLGLTNARILAEEKLEENLLRFFEKNLGVQQAVYAAVDERGRYAVRWWIRDGAVAVERTTEGVDRTLPRSLQRLIAAATQVRHEPRSLDLFIEAPDFYPGVAGFTLLPLMVQEQRRACVVLPQESTAAAENADELQFLHAVRTEVELALARVVAVGELDQLKRNLELLVERRTAELESTNLELARANTDLGRANADLAHANSELGRANDEIQRQLRQLKVLDRAKTDFLLNVSFELRNPLNLILSPLQVLLDPRRETDPETRDLLETIKKNTLTLLKHITHLLQLQQRDNYNLFLNYRTVQPREMLERIVAIAEERGRATGIDVRLVLEPDLPDVIIDPEKVSSALHAILSNAFKFNRPGGSVEVRCAIEEGWLRVDVRDTGIGIEEAQQSRLFERFQAHGDPMRMETTGIGIGLSVASDYVQMHKGRIAVKSRKGQGTTFSVYLPLGDAHVEEAFRERRRRSADDHTPGRRSADLERSNMSLYVADQDTLEYIDIVDLQGSRERRQARYSLVSRKTILFVHADPRFVEIAESILLEYVNVRTAKDGAEAWEILLKEHPDVLVTSPALPKLTGLELIRDVRATAAVQKTPVILLSEKIDLESSLKGLEGGADLYMSVPVDFNALVAHIKQLIEMRDLRAALEADKTSLEDKVARLADEREKLSMGVIEAMALAIDAKDRYTHGHSARVREFATDFARHLGLDQHAIKRLEFSSILHDIGKIGIPEGILNKKERLTDEEWKIVRSHPVKGVEILGALPGFPDALKEIRHHHERWDGRGYPDGLKGENIPVGARLLALADSYDAMSFGRIYRDARSGDEIAHEIERCAGSQFDPELAPKFLEFLSTRPN